MLLENDCCIFFFKQRTAYEMRISDWSSDVCSSDLVDLPNGVLAIRNLPGKAVLRRCDLQFAGQALVGAGLEEVGNTLECRGHFRSGERCQLVSGVEVRDEEVQNSFVIKIGSASCRERVCHYG